MPRFIMRKAGAANIVTALVSWQADPGVIAPEKLDLVFERFRRVDASDARGKGGSGLGLATCRGIAEARDGRIWVTSVLGTGSVFSIAIPAAPPAIEEAYCAT